LACTCTCQCTQCSCWAVEIPKGIAASAGMHIV
jgi:hypothetical protein